MKSNKPAFAAIAVVLALWASNAKAAPELPFQFEKLNFSLIALQQELGNSGPYTNIVVPNIETSKIINKDLLSFLATALNTNWPAGAQLALGEIEGPFGIQDIFVVDKTGTNPVFDVSTGINVGDTNIVYFVFDSDAVVFSFNIETHNEGPSSSAETQFGKIFFHLFNEQNGVTNTDLYFDGLNTTKSRSTRVITTNKTILHQIMNEDAPVAGDGTFNGEWTVVKGKVTSSAKQELVPLILTNPPPPIIFTNILTNIPIRSPTNWPPPIIITNIIIPLTNIFTLTNRPPSGFYPTTNQPLPILFNP